MITELKLTKALATTVLSQWIKEQSYHDFLFLWSLPLSDVIHQQTVEVDSLWITWKGLFEEKYNLRKKNNSPEYCLSLTEKK